MARPLRQLTPEANALWDNILARYDAGHVTIDDIAQLIGMSERTIYSRLREARDRMEDRLPDEPVAENAGSDKERPGSEVDEGVWLVLTDDPRDEVRPTRDYAHNPVTGEPSYHIHHYYNLSDDSTSLDAVGGAVLVGSRNGASCVGGQSSGRTPAPRLEGQRLKRNRLGTGKRDDQQKPKSEKKCVNDEDKAKGVKFAQVPGATAGQKAPKLLKGGLG